MRNEDHARHPHLPKLLTSAALLGSLLAACGGGGTDATESLADPALVEEPTVRALAAKTSTSSGVTYTGTTMTVKTTGWSAWTKRLNPVYSGPYSLVGDPSVIRDGSTLRMSYNCFDPYRQRGAVCVATSSNGTSWTNVTVNDPIPGRVIQTRPAEWDDAHETPLIYKNGSEHLLFFSGYVDKGGFVNSFPAHFGLATSTDGVKFTRYGSAPVLSPTPGWYDNDAVASPSIVSHNGQLVMIYTGHCWTNCLNGWGMYLLAATSTDGRTWTKRPTPVMSRADLPFTQDGAAEAEIIKGPDGYYYLFMSYLYGEKGHDIGIARSSTPFGPWDINPTPIVQRTAGRFDAIGTIAPSVVIEDGKAKMWFHGFGTDSTIRIGYAEAPWPLRLQ